MALPRVTDDSPPPPPPALAPSAAARLTLVPGDAPMRDGRDGTRPEPGALVEAQFVDAVYRLHEDTSRYPRFPWPALDDITGPMAPGEFWLVAARPGNGKTLFFLNLWDALVAQGRSGLYVGLEQTPMEMRIKWACLRTGVSPLGALAGKWPDGMTADEILAARDAVQRDLKRQRSPEVKRLAHFSEAQFLDAKRLRQWTEWAVDECGAEYVIVDHINRVARDATRSAFDGHSEVITTAKSLALSEHVAMLAASQVGRPSGDPVARFTPPALHELRGGGTSEEEANAVLTVFRPLKPEVTESEMKQVRLGLREDHTLYEPGTMAVRVLKHRLDGLQLGRQCVLDVTHGRLSERDPRHQHRTAFRV